MCMMIMNDLIHLSNFPLCTLTFWLLAILNTVKSSKVKVAVLIDLHSLRCNFEAVVRRDTTADIRLKRRSSAWD